VQSHGEGETSPPSWSEGGKRTGKKGKRRETDETHNQRAVAQKRGSEPGAGGDETNRLFGGTLTRSSGERDREKKEPLIIVRGKKLVIAGAREIKETGPGVGRAAWGTAEGQRDNHFEGSMAGRTHGLDPD